MKTYFAVAMAFSLMVVVAKAQGDYSLEVIDEATTTDYDYSNPNNLGVRENPPNCKGELRFGINPNIQILHLTRTGSAGGPYVVRTMGITRTSMNTRNGNVKISGTCCAKIYNRPRYRGNSQKLELTQDGPVNFSKVRSMIFGVCNKI